MHGDRTDNAHRRNLDNSSMGFVSNNHSRDIPGLSTAARKPECQLSVAGMPAN